MKNDKAFKEGMIAGAKPFEEKYEKLGAEIEQVKDSIERKLEEEYSVQDEINDYFDKKLNTVDKKKFFNLKESYDVKDEEVLNQNEQEYLLAYLLTLSNQFDTINEKQQKYIVSLANYLELKVENVTVNLEAVENIEKTSGQQAFFQTILEFMFLRNESFDFIEEYDEILSCFYVAPKKRKEIQKKILEVYTLLGSVGIMNKYGSANESFYEDMDGDTESYEEKTVRKEISKECADKINVEDYIELNDYLVCCKFEDSKYRLFKVEKLSGLETRLDAVKYDEGGYSWKEDVFCSATKLFIKPYPKNGRNYIYVYDIETLEESRVEYYGDKDYESRCEWMQCNEKYIVYMARKNDRLILCCYDLDKEETIINKPFMVDLIEGTCLAGNKLLYWSYDECIALDLSNNKTQRISSPQSGKHSIAMGGRFMDGTINVSNGIACSWIDGSMCVGNAKVFYYEYETDGVIKEFKIPYAEKVEVYRGDKKIYYFTVDSSKSLYSYDLQTREHKLVKKGIPAVAELQEGFLKRKTTYVSPIAGIVGKWFYYRKERHDDLQWVCLD